MQLDKDLNVSLNIEVTADSHKFLWAWRAVAFIVTPAAVPTLGEKYGEGQTVMAKLAKISEKTSEV